MHFFFPFFFKIYSRDFVLRDEAEEEEDEEEVDVVD